MYKVKSGLHGVEVPIGHCSNLPNRPLLTCIGYSMLSLPALIGERVALSPICQHHYPAEPRWFCGGPTLWNGLPLVLRLLPRTLSDTFDNQLKTAYFDCAGVGSTSE